MPILVVVVAMLVVITIPIVLMVALVFVLVLVLAVLVFVLVLDIDRTRRGPPFAPKAPCAQHCDNTQRYAAHAATVARLVPTLQALPVRR